VHEYSQLFPYLAPLTPKYRDKRLWKEYLDEVENRFGSGFVDKVRQEGEASIPIKACFVFHDVDEMEESLQIFSDLMVSKDGIPGSKRNENEAQFVNVYTTSPDLSKC
jgi:hypothetical protein